MMKTINHKGKTLHHHTASGFYIDLAAVIEFAAALDARIEQRMAQRNELMKPPYAKLTDWPKPEVQSLLLCRKAHIVIEDTSDEDTPYAYGSAEGQHWVCGAEVSFNEWQHGSDPVTKDMPNIWRKCIGKIVYWALPYSRSPLYGSPLESDWFPMSACYSPARIALENMQ